MASNGVLVSEDDIVPVSSTMGAVPSALSQLPEKGTLRLMLSAEQCKEVMARFGQYLGQWADGAAGAEWPRTLAQAATEYWQSHLNAPAVKVAGIMLGIQVAGSAKVAIVEELVASRFKLVTFERILAYHEEALEWARENHRDAGDSPAAAPEHGGAGGEDGLGNESGNLVEGQSGGPQGGGAGGQLEGGGQVPTVPGMFTQDQVASMIAACIQKVQARDNGSPANSWNERAIGASSGQYMCQWERLLTNIRRSVSNRCFVDIVMLGSANQEYLKFKAPHASRNQQVQAQLGLVMLEETGMDVREVYNVVQAREGMDRLLVMYAQCPVVKYRVPDMLEWNMMVWAYKGPSEGNRVRYMKAFMQKYARQCDWAGKFSSDHSLISEYMFSMLGGGRTVPGSDRGGGRNTKKERHAHVVDSPRDRKLKKARSGYCDSRAMQSAPACKFGATCRFKHECASCGADHAAKDCPAWDEAKAISVAPRRNP